MKVVGLVLAGGRSSRFGREKAMADVAGRPMIAWVLDVLKPDCAEVAISAKAGTEAADFADRMGYVTLADEGAYPQGPLAGVRAGLAWARAEGADALATAPCDTPFLPAGLVANLVQGWTLGDGARVATSPNGMEPLCALWPAAALELIGETLAAGRHPPIRQVLERLRAVAVAFSDPTAFANLNTPLDYAAATQSKPN